MDAFYEVRSKASNRVVAKFLLRVDAVKYARELEEREGTHGPGYFVHP